MVRDPVYSESTPGTVMSVPKGGGAPKVLASGQGNPNGIGQAHVAYSAVPDEDADAHTVLLLDERERRRKSFMLVSTSLAVFFIAAVVALELALAIGIRPTVALRPNFDRSNEPTSVIGPFRRSRCCNVKSETEPLRTWPNRQPPQHHAQARARRHNRR